MGNLNIQKWLNPRTGIYDIILLHVECGCQRVLGHYWDPSTNGPHRSGHMLGTIGALVLTGHTAAALLVIGTLRRKLVSPKKRGRH